MSSKKLGVYPTIPSTTLFLLRHGEVDEQSRKSLYGQLDVRLSPLGLEQSRLAGLALKKHPIRAVYSSDLYRARHLGWEVARHHGLQPSVDDRLRERHFGDWQGLAWDIIESEHAEDLERYVMNRHSMRVPGKSENFHDVRFRVLPVIREVVARHPNQHIAITAHSGTCRIILAEVLGLTLDKIFTFEQEFCCINKIEFHSDGAARVRLLNYTEHLEKVS